MGTEWTALRPVRFPQTDAKGKTTIHTPLPPGSTTFVTLSTFWIYFVI